MCFSQYAQYVPRPVKQLENQYEYEAPVRPAGAPPTKADLDPNLFGPKPLPPEWQQAAATANGNGHNQDHDHTHTHATSETAGQPAVQVAASQNGASVASITTQTVEAVVVELSNGTKLLIATL